VLTQAGYQVTESQPQIFWSLQCDGSPLEIELRVDYLVEREGKRYVAEVKTGEHAPRLTNAATRRQLLEYRVAYPEVDGALLVDMEAERVMEVAFDIPPTSAAPARRPSIRWQTLAITTCASALAGAILARWL